MAKLDRCSERVVHLAQVYARNSQSQQGGQEEYHQNFKVEQVCQGCIHLQYICNSCASGVHLTLHLSRRCTAVVVLLQQGVLLGSLWDSNFTKSIVYTINIQITIHPVSTDGAIVIYAFIHTRCVQHTKHVSRSWSQQLKLPISNCTWSQSPSFWSE